MVDRRSLIAREPNVKFHRVDPKSERTPKSSHRVLRGRRGYATVGDDPEWRFRQRASGHDVIIAYRRASPS